MLSTWLPKLADNPNGIADKMQHRKSFSMKIERNGNEISTIKLSAQKPDTDDPELWINLAGTIDDVSTLVTNLIFQNICLSQLKFNANSQIQQAWDTKSGWEAAVQTLKRNNMQIRNIDLNQKWLSPQYAEHKVNIDFINNKIAENIIGKFDASKIKNTVRQEIRNNDTQKHKLADAIRQHLMRGKEDTLFGEQSVRVETLTSQDIKHFKTFITKLVTDNQLHIKDILNTFVSEYHEQSYQANHIAKLINKDALSGKVFSNNQCMLSSTLNAVGYAHKDGKEGINITKDGVLQQPMSFKAVVEDAREYLYTLAQEKVTREAENANKDWRELAKNKSCMLSATGPLMQELLKYWIGLGIIKQDAEKNKKLYLYQYSGVILTRRVFTIDTSDVTPPENYYPVTHYC